ncbi:hypothetical protein OLS35_10680 [Campylobacter jejuni]|nr:hypothetical protein [Campylobacter jejuni]
MTGAKIGFFSEPTKAVDFLKNKSQSLVLIMMNFHIQPIKKSLLLLSLWMKAC